MSFVANPGPESSGSRRTDLWIAVVEAACGVIAATYLIAIGIQANATGLPGRTLVDRLTPFVLAFIILVVLLRLSLRSYRRSLRPAPASDVTASDAHPAQRVRPTEASHPDVDARPLLSDEGRRDLTQVINVLAASRLFAPQVPDPRDLEEAVADAGEPVTVGTVLMALHEADYWHPGFRPDDYLAALAFHDSQTEQDRGTLSDQVDDLSRLVGHHLSLRLDNIEVSRVGGSERTQIDLTIDGAPQHLDYASHPKRLSTVLHIAVAQALQAPGSTTDDRPRLAWLWTDQGVWLAALDRDATLSNLNRALGRPDPELWTWVDDEPPMAAGDTIPGYGPG